MSEADTCRKHVVPALQLAGWEAEPHSIAEQRSITDGRIIPVGKGFIRKPPKRVDAGAAADDLLELAHRRGIVNDLAATQLLSPITPRPVVRFMVEAVDPRLGELVEDPASGTGGFVVEAFKHLSKQVKTVAHRKTLQTTSLQGIEAKPLPYLLCQMNLLLHGLQAPRIDPGNALRHKLTEIGDKQRVDVILTNPPFGGSEEKGIQDNFPSDKRTSETALLFLQLIMRKLRRGPRPGRAAVVVPNGTLFGDGVCARIKEDLLKEFNLHTIVRLPNGTFAPYTSIPTNILFFDRNGPTKAVWYYEHPLPEGRKSYTKTQPIQFDEFAGCLRWWKARKKNERAWKVPAAELLANGCNLDRKNPSAKEDIAHLPPEELAASILEKERRIEEIVTSIQQLLKS